MRVYMLRTWLLPVLLLIANHSKAQINLTDTTAVYRIDQFVEVLFDSSNMLTIDSIQNPGIQAKFHPKGNLIFGYAKPNIWLKITSTSQNKARWYLEIPAPFLEYVDFYQQENKIDWHRYESGYFRKQNLRVIPHTGHVFPLAYSNQANVSYVKISGTSPKTFPIYILNKDKFNDLIRWEDLGYGVFFGILIIMFFYNLFIFISLKQINYLLYICTILCTMSVFLSSTGYGGKFLWPNSPHLNYYAGRVSLPFLIFFLAIFSIRFLEVKKYSLWNYHILRSLIGLSFLSLALVVTEISVSSGNNLISIATIVFIGTGINCRWHGNKTATFYIVGWSFYFVGGLFLTLRNSGFFEFNFWTTHFVEIGAAMETTFIAFALGDQFRRLKQEKEEIQLIALQAQQDARARLEIQVTKRTQELSDANKELSLMLATLKEKNTQIEVKNEELDTFFYRISHDLNAPISSLVGLSSLAKHDIKDPESLIFFEKQYEQVLRLNEIVKGLVNIIRIGDKEQHKVVIDFDKMIKDCISSFNTLQKADTINYTIVIQPGIIYSAEWVILNAIFQNLIENSIKYSSERSPFLRIEITETNKDILCKVEDNGLGIPKEHQNKIFDLFYRATQKSSGSGIGLYILKRSVDKLNGKIEVASIEGQGTTFTITLPKESAEVQ